MSLLKSGHSVILLHNDLFVKVVISTEYEETLEEAAQREASFQMRARSLIDSLKSPVKVSVPNVHGVIKNVLVIEKVAGISVERLIRNNIERARELVPSLDLAVKELGRNKIYHNDLYHDNIMWDEKSQTIWITDFGMAQDYHGWDCDDPLSEFTF